MKSKASLFLKHVLSVLSSIAKSKSVAIKNKTNAARGRLLLFTLMSKKAVLGSLSNKIHNLLGHGDDSDSDGEDKKDESRAIVLYSARSDGPCSSSTHIVQRVNEDDDDKYPDLRHSLCDEGESDYEDDPGKSVIDVVKDLKEGGEDFILEDEIDHVADLFIKRFHKQIQLQKLESFKRFQAMLERSL
ncbi:uncharacterized protein LOC116200575 [Punica granatum]|uniref:Uncharacterized protein n=2 Tax=Punica granatum TaxID=22663 RepID=A0A218XYW1_PUNGR|nr:uncharacterized protein LOC116200575 [Punica granatum]OWM89826.1 hypothetical protein CDL15_Pgr024575 [Punica granatum]PKI71571.1 hypothetical protein CRG98_008088 [Punica granatum]